MLKKGRVIDPCQTLVLFSAITSGLSFLPFQREPIISTGVGLCIEAFSHQEHRGMEARKKEGDPPLLVG